MLPRESAYSIYLVLTPLTIMQSFTLDQTALDILAQFVSNPKIRPSISGVNVQINDDGNTLTLVSTDSFRMHKTIVKKVSNTFPNYEPFFVDNSPASPLPYDSIDKLIKACKLSIAIDKKNPIVTLSNTRVQYGFNKGRTDSHSTLTDYHESVIINLSHSETVKLNANYLLDILKQIEKIKKQIGVSPVVTIQNESPLSKLFITFSDTNSSHEHIIMPLK